MILVREIFLVTPSSSGNINYLIVATVERNYVANSIKYYLLWSNSRESLNFDEIGVELQ